MLADSLLDALALLLPVECAGCGRDDRSLCGSCRDRLMPNVTQHRAGNLEVLSALRYEDHARSAILAFKEHGRTDVARPLGRALAASILPLLPAADLIVTVPSSRSAFSRRGFDPVAMLLGKAGYSRVSVLEHTRESGAQKALGVDERATNRGGALAATRRLDGSRVLLVDDVVTTGATLSEAARALSAAGAVVTSAATLAFTPRLLRRK